MALTSKQTERVKLPHEPDAWIEIRKPSVGIMQKVSGWVADNGGPDSDFAKIGAAILLAAECITAWSYDAPIDLETVSDLDTETLSVLETALMAAPDPKNSSRRSTKR